MMKANAGIYILSWFGDRNNPTLRQKRVSTHMEQLEWAKSTGYTITVFAQDYNESEYQEGIRYIINEEDEIYPPSKGRNILLEAFYCSDHDAAIMCDNDSIYTNSQKMTDIAINDMIDLKLVSIRGQAIERMPELVEIESHFDSSTLANRVYNLVEYAVSSIYILSNLRKCGKKEVFYHPSYVERIGGAITPGEDTHFAFDLAIAGGVYYMTGLVMKEICLAGYGHNDSNEDSTWCNTKEVYDSLKGKGDNILFETFGNAENLSKDEFEQVFMKHVLRGVPNTLTVQGGEK